MYFCCIMSFVVFILGQFFTPCYYILDGLKFLLAHFAFVIIDFLSDLFFIVLYTDDLILNDNQKFFSFWEESSSF